MSSQGIGNSVALSATHTVGAMDLEGNNFFTKFPPEVVDEADAPQMDGSRRAKGAVRMIAQLRFIRNSHVSKIGKPVNVAQIGGLRCVTHCNIYISRNFRNKGKMKKEDSRRLSIVLSVSLICLGLAQWLEPSEFPMRWKWLQDMTNNLLGNHGLAKFLIFTGVIWLFWNVLVVLKNSSKAQKQ